MRKLGKNGRYALSKHLGSSGSKTHLRVIRVRLAAQGSFQGVPGTLHRLLQCCRQTGIVLLSAACQKIDNRIQWLDAAGPENIIDELFEKQTGECFPERHGGHPAIEEEILRFRRPDSDL